MSETNVPRGMNAMSAEDQKKIASMGGKSHTSEHMREIGKRGGLKISRDREYMSRIGKLGGAARSKKLAADKG